MNWRKWNNILHRDMGYFFFGLTIIYAVSGLALNHIQDWNPNYHIEKSETNIGTVTSAESVSDEMIGNILERLGEAGKYKSIFFADPETLQIFMEEKNITVNLRTGDVQMEKVESRLILREMNFLHLNHPKKIWTLIADLYAVCLAIMAITGLFILKGRYGITGRCACLTGMGILLPVFFLWLYF